MRETRKLAIAFGPETSEATVEFMSAQRRCHLTMRLHDGRVLTAEEGDYFECLRTIRKVLEAEGGLVLCQGARRDVWPSRMARDMGAGLKVYVNVSGRTPTLDDLVNTFDPVEPDLVGTVVEQEAAFRGWLGARGMPPPRT